jgi:phosphatidylinositol-3-phosphatase
MKMKTKLLVAAIALACATQGQAGILQSNDGYADNDHNDKDNDHHVKKVFVIALENHNWTQPSTQTSPQQEFLNPAAPFINSLVNGSSGISDQVAFANAYINAAAGDHPSEPNYIWSEAGTNFGVNNDDNPYNADCTPDTVQTTDQHLSAFLTKAGKSWKSYQEDTDVDATNTPLPVSEWTVPLYSKSGVWTPGVNGYNYSNQYNYAAKHNPMVYFTDTNGGCDTSTSNPLRLQYAPLQQLALDLTNNTVADYNWISPDQYNDQHTSLDKGYGQYPKGDSAQIAQGDNFLARIVPLIMASDAYQDGGMIVLWWDESEGGDDPSRTLPFMIISKDVHKNVSGVPYSNTIQYSHSSTLRTMQEIFDVDPRHGYPWLGDAANATDLSDLFKPGTIR